MRLISLLTVMIMISSCTKKTKVNDFEEYRGMKLTESRTKSIHGNISYTLDLPDTLRVNQLYDVVFNFNSPFDTIVDPMVSDSLKFRAITMFYYKPIKVGVKNKDSDFVIKDSMYIPNKQFILGNFKIEDTGKYVFLVLIEDQIMNYHYNSEGKNDSVHFDRIFEEITKEVVVIE